MAFTEYGIIAPKFKKALEDGAFQPDFSTDAESLRQTFDPKQGSDLVEGIEEASLSIPARDGHCMSGRVWRLTNPSENGPLIILFHPGGHVVGNHWICEADGRLLTQRLGCVCVAVDYRRGPEYPFPKAVEDTHDVVKWAAGFAGEIKADTSKGFVLYGVSAGANLAAVVALLARDEKLTPQLTGVMLASPFLFTPESVPDMYKPFYNSWDQCQESPIVNRKAMLALRAKYNPDVRSWLFNPSLHPDGLAGLPPTYFQICGYDPLRDDGLIYEKMIREVYGVSTRVDAYVGMPHIFWIGWPEELEEESAQSREDLVSATAWILGRTGHVERLKEVDVAR